MKRGVAGICARIRSECDRKGEQGIALLSVIMLILVLSFVSAAAIVTSTTELKIGGNFKTSVQSFYNAEAGVQYALGQIRNGYRAGTLNLTGSPFVVHYAAPGSSLYPLLSNGKFPFSNWTATHLFLKAGTTGDYRFQTDGYYANAKTSLQAVVRVPSFYPVKGMFASGAVDVKNNLTLVGPEVAEFGSDTLVDIGNSGLPKVVLGGGATYAGPAPVSHVNYINPDPLGAASLVAAHNYSVANNNVSAGIVSNTISGSKTLGPGNYYLTSLNNGNLTINGGGEVNIYVANSLSLTNITINPGSGPVTIYYHGSGTVGLGGATLNSGGSAGNLSIICDTGSTAPIPTAETTFDFQGAFGAFSGLVYAPYASLLFKNNDSARGMLWAKSISVMNNMTFQYDAAAAAYFGTASTPALVSWKQL